MEMAKLNRIKAIDFVEQARADGAAKHIKWMRRDGQDRVAAATAQLSQIVEVFELRNFAGSHIEHNHVRALQTHFRGGNQQNPHRGGIGKHFRSIKDGIVQRDGEHAKAQVVRPLEQLMRGIIDDVLGIIQSVNMEIDFDPFVFVPRARLPRRS